MFPGFVEAELTELPGQMEAPQILHRVTKAQDFNVRSAHTTPLTETHIAFNVTKPRKGYARKTAGKKISQQKYKLLRLLQNRDMYLHFIRSNIIIDGFLEIKGLQSIVYGIE